MSPIHFPHPDPGTWAQLGDVVLGLLLIASVVVIGMLASCGVTP